MLLNNKWVNQEIQEETKKYMDTNENEKTVLQNLWNAAKVVLRVFYSNTGLPQETGKISNKQPNLTLKSSRRRRPNTTKIQQKEGNNKY